MMNKNQLKGRADSAMGKIKEIMGRVTGKGSMERKGQVEQAGGKVEAASGDLKNDIGKAAKMSHLNTV